MIGTQHWPNIKQMRTRPAIGVDDGAVGPGSQAQPQRVGDVDEVVKDHLARLLGQPHPVLLHEDQVARVVGACDVPRRVSPVESDRQADVSLLGAVHLFFAEYRKRWFVLGAVAGAEERAALEKSAEAVRSTIAAL